ncbi:hypothetical protein A2738_00070 [Candidatus Nomurabacteria bacterium RIFCSPHIGHO2_01_FULL_42_15]|uniref:ParB-like N-terminal domain-containing protein n=1 Tax=Candidatus Nomurabacteria bacterium RIFCSPHIGHO2_01_FULL_42_15 TaxID=1801742 RepID=A0A1F6VGG7_9BACT|nr:MAG: hypothetical protein A2738_00070 [Candidatus Nomurabacteria bacterium RIFCSPHIGHO2_01_FULL_42_15]OGI92863.1 MAG: hypothetical protein A3A99_02340 [Candidatus Nomurabacteria bacterium RIFCSPLOWO2_01_FULL_41_18]
MKTKPQRTGKTVLEITGVSVSSGRQNGHSDTKAFGVLQEAGFVELKYATNRTTAQPPGGGLLFLVAYDASNPANQKPFQMVRLQSQIWKEIDTGNTMYIQAVPSSNGSIEVFLRGNCLDDWELKCKMADAKTAEAYKIMLARDGILKSNKPIPRSTRREEAHTASPPKPEEEDEEEKEEVVPPPRVTLPMAKVTPPRLVVQLSPVIPEKKVIPPPVAVSPPARTVAPVAPVLENKSLGEELVLHIPLSEIVCFQKQESDPSFSGQPRKDFDESDLKKLAGSIKRHGQKVPALVRRIDTIAGKKWELIAGERRWRALQLIGFPYLRAIEEKPVTKKQQHMLSLIENLFRVDPSSLEISDALQEQIEAGETQVSLAEATSLSLTQIRKLLSIKSVHPDLRPLLKSSVPEEDRIRLLEASVLSSIHPDHQVEIWNKAKGQPSRRLIVAKLHELGRPFFQYKRGVRSDRRKEAGRVTQLLDRRFNALSLALIELQAVNAEEWRKFVILRGTARVSADMTLLTETIRGINEVKQKISRAKVATRSDKSAAADTV